MLVSANGRYPNYDFSELIQFCDQKEFFIIEDAAQSIGSKYEGKFSGTFGEIGCFSAHPLKNLNACGARANSSGTRINFCGTRSYFLCHKNNSCATRIYSCATVSYTHLRAHETPEHLGFRGVRVKK